jgi:hypothetical protein
MFTTIEKPCLVWGFFFDALGVSLFVSASAASKTFRVVPISLFVEFEKNSTAMDWSEPEGCARRLKTKSVGLSALSAGAGKVAPAGCRFYPLRKLALWPYWNASGLASVCNG